MSTREDPLVKLLLPGSRQDGLLDRTFYATGISLDADDFIAEQTYSRGRLARALRYLHGSGTLAGLRVFHVDPADDHEEEIQVGSGVAIDRIGRLVEVPRRACIRIQRWYAQQSPADLRQGLHDTPRGRGVLVDLYLRFVACGRGKTPSMASGPFEALDAVSPSRLRDGYLLQLIVRKEADPPLPAPAWTALPADPDASARRRALHERILDGWREEPDLSEIERERALDPGDPTSVFLARLLMPAQDPASPDERPARQGTAVISLDEERRPFIYGAWALASWMGL